MFSTRTFRNLDLGIDWVLRYKVMELESHKVLCKPSKKSCSGKTNIRIIF